MKKYRVGIIISVFVVVIGYIINYYFNPFAKRIQFLEKEIPKYHLIENADSINAKIASFFTARGFVYVETQNSEKLAIEVSRNGLYEKNFIGDFLQTGDSLIKEFRNDTLYVSRRNMKYYFVVGRVINED